MLWHWMLCERHSVHFHALQERGLAKQKEVWHTKIKNKLKIMTDITMNIIEVMEEIENTCLYFFNMHELIGQHPNCVPTGPDENKLHGYASEEWDTGKQPAHTNNNCSKFDHDSEPSNQGSDNADKYLALAPKHESEQLDDGPALRKKKTKKDEFAESVRAEELTWQKEVEVARANAEKGTMRARLEAAATLGSSHYHANQNVQLTTMTLSFNSSFNDDLPPVTGSNPSTAGPSSASCSSSFCLSSSLGDPPLDVEYFLPAAPQL
ncbi:hypothetical protein PAXRUDRAFT_36352 [Paxillus rubicundulus Ve08.2h10]|uniref:Uncharacterized protein n=1 Tax=Paxillus rubicundulus Ve08.2h10 TaxID=930991 RepID=A0A0D0CW92_9AGAM|nr:hypothetical protein PAXRUDRAFT_36352 [Paxillus rubicundulus Ve08.2h10]